MPSCYLDSYIAKLKHQLFFFFKLTLISTVPLNFTNVSITVDDTGVVRGMEIFSLGPPERAGTSELSM